MERMETRFIREIARVNHQNAQLQQQVMKLQAGDGAVDPELAAEWRGQEIAFKRMLDTIGG